MFLSVLYNKILHASCFGLRTLLSLLISVRRLSFPSSIFSLHHKTMPELRECIAHYLLLLWWFEYCVSTGADLQVLGLWATSRDVLPFSRFFLDELGIDRTINTFESKAPTGRRLRCATRRNIQESRVANITL